MKITLIAVMSLDGKITKWDDIQDVSTWASAEDQEFFMSQIAKHKVIVMGRKTYEAVSGKILSSHPEFISEPVPNLFRESSLNEMPKQVRHDIPLRIVMTSRPEEFKKDGIAGKLEFSSESPQEIVTRLEQQGISELLVVGGGSVNTAFLKAGIVNELYITIEPVIFGKGKTIIYNEKFNIKLQLIEIKQMNSRGTLLLYYSSKR